MGFDFHWFKLCLIAVVMLWVSHLCHVYSGCLAFIFFSSQLALCLPVTLRNCRDLDGYFSCQQHHMKRLDQHSG